MKKTLILVAAALMMAGCNCSKEEQTSTITNADATMATIMSRKSVRSFTGEAVSDSTINLLLQAAMAAPSGRNIQPWHFVVLRDTSSYTQIFSEANFNMPIFKASSAIVVFCADTTVTAPPRENPQGEAVTRPNGLWRDDLGASTENLLLAVEALGLGAVWTALYPYPERMNPVREALALPANVVPYCAVPIGVPTGDDQPKDKWKPERIHHGTW